MTTYLNIFEVIGPFGRKILGSYKAEAFFLHSSLFLSFWSSWMKTEKLDWQVFVFVIFYPIRLKTELRGQVGSISVPSISVCRSQKHPDGERTWLSSDISPTWHDLVAQLVEYWTPTAVKQTFGVDTLRDNITNITPGTDSRWYDLFNSHICSLASFES
jgi:hypothetical protein